MVDEWRERNQGRRLPDGAVLMPQQKGHSMTIQINGIPVRVVIVQDCAAAMERYLARVERKRKERTEA